nr:MAG TPA: hypothetical protein [Caudoviricetes sp.]
MKSIIFLLSIGILTKTREVLIKIYCNPNIFDFQHIV